MSDLHPFALARTQQEALDIADLVEDLREFLQDQEDADHNGTSYVPNDAMRLLMRLNELFPEEDHA